VPHQPAHLAFGHALADGPGALADMEARATIGKLALLP